MILSCVSMKDSGAADIRCSHTWTAPAAVRHRVMATMDRVITQNAVFSTFCACAQLASRPRSSGMV